MRMAGFLKEESFKKLRIVLAMNGFPYLMSVDRGILSLFQRIGT